MAWVLAVLSVVLALVGAVRIALAFVRGNRGGRFSDRNVAVSVLLEALAALAMVVCFSIG